MTKNINSELLIRIEKALDTIRPYLVADGGDINLVEITKSMTAKVEFTGSCSSCTVNRITLENGIEVAIKRAAPEIKRVLEISQLDTLI